MSKTNDTSNLATLEDRDTLADRELNAVTGGRTDSIPGESTDKQPRDWFEFPTTPTDPVGVWKGLLHQYGY